jgi:hypothetical protein
VIRLNFNGSGWFAPPGGFPLRLSRATDLVCSGVVPKGYETLTATVQCDAGATADVSLAIYTMPTTTTGSDGVEVDRVDEDGVGSAESTITLSLPETTTMQPVPYVVRFWVRELRGSDAETVSRDGSTAAADLPKIPFGLELNSLVAT